MKIKKKEKESEELLIFRATVVEFGGKRYFSFKAVGSQKKVVLIETLPCYTKENINLVIKRNGGTIYSDPQLDHLDRFLDDKKSNHISAEKMKVRDTVRFIFPEYTKNTLERKEQALVHLAWFFEKFEE
jgi:hypothetical protein